MQETRACILHAVSCEQLLYSCYAVSFIWKAHPEINELFIDWFQLFVRRSLYIHRNENKRKGTKKKDRLIKQFWQLVTSSQEEPI